MSLTTIKNLFPPSFLRFLRKIRQKIYGFVDLFFPKLNSRNYFGYKLFYITGSSLIDRIRFLSPDKVYERELVESISKNLANTSESVFLDIGANIGLISLYILAHNPLTKIYAFEPSKHQSKLLAQTLQINGLENRIKLYEQAVSNFDGVSKFAAAGEGDGSGDGFIDTGRSGKQLEFIDVKTVTLDSWWKAQGMPKVDVIKIDVEGAEKWVFEGAVEVLEDSKPFIYFEISNLNLAKYPYTYKDIIDWLDQHDYEVYDLNGNNYNSQSIESVVDTIDIYLAKYKNVKIF